MQKFMRLLKITLKKNHSTIQRLLLLTCFLRPSNLIASKTAIPPAITMITETMMEFYQLGLVAL